MAVLCRSWSKIVLVKSDAIGGQNECKWLIKSSAISQTRTQTYCTPSHCAGTALTVVDYVPCVEKGGAKDLGFESFQLGCDGVISMRASPPPDNTDSPEISVPPRQLRRRGLPEIFRGLFRSLEQIRQILHFHLVRLGRCEGMDSFRPG